MSVSAINQIATSSTAINDQTQNPSNQSLQLNQFNNMMNFKNQQQMNTNLNNNVNTTVNKANDEYFERKEPLLLKRGYISP